MKFTPSNSKAGRLISWKCQFFLQCSKHEQWSQWLPTGLQLADSHNPEHCCFFFWNLSCNGVTLPSWHLCLSKSNPSRGISQKRALSKTACSNTMHALLAMRVIFSSDKWAAQQHHSTIHPVSRVHFPVRLNSTLVYCWACEWCDQCARGHHFQASPELSTRSPPKWPQLSLPGKLPVTIISGWQKPPTNRSSMGAYLISAEQTDKNLALAMQLCRELLSKGRPVLAITIIPHVMRTFLTKISVWRVGGHTVCEYE